MKRQYLQRGGREATEEDMLDRRNIEAYNDRNVEMLRGKVYGRTYSKLSLSFQIYREDVRKVVVPEWGPSLKMSLKSKIMGIVLSKMIMARVQTG
jgi:hypothetical protein